MRKKVSLIVLTCLLICVCFAAAAEQNGDYVYDKQADGTAKITKYKGEGGDLIIPAELDGLKVTSMGIGAFCDCKGLKNVTIPKNVTFIARNADANCPKVIPNVTKGSYGEQYAIDNNIPYKAR